ncbi:peroxisomal biogenesis factor 19 [Musa troglodytarum]|uniref:Peroxisomal biogenesis factor 19 n=1 Tax=Musa troglodytarum TaxID=320322 RepID=A0A9E7EP28_9LILI|nr:peroxisomal biogenesis factor 19 [Musa troglodytarum]URD82506.1 peroxisomal biogenesis factor 19 [Musa troglodytarum]
MADPASDDLDPLLDSALDDFSKLGLAPAAQRSDGDGDGGEGTATLPSMASAPRVQGLGMGLPDLGGARRKRQQRARPGGSHAFEALEKLTQLTREAVRGLESATGAAVPRGGDAGFDEDSMVGELVKQYEELAGSQDVESIVESLMQQLLSKDILHEPMREIGERYPKWLEEHKNDLNQEEYDRYYYQYELILKLNDVYENDPENFSKIVDLMQTIQECGEPPGDIVQELAPDLDLSNFRQFCDRYRSSIVAGRRPGYCMCQDGLVLQPIEERQQRDTLQITWLLPEQSITKR